MIVGSMFDGDDYEELQLQQHDAYQQAIRIMIDECLVRFRQAETIVGQATELGDAIRQKPSFDHRDIQPAHDDLAAIWRARLGLTHPPLSLPGFHVEKFATEWLQWLRQEMVTMDGWRVSLLLKAVFLSSDEQDEAEQHLLNALGDDLARALRDKP